MPAMELSLYYVFKMRLYSQPVIYEFSCMVSKKQNNCQHSIMDMIKHVLCSLMGAAVMYKNVVFYSYSNILSKCLAEYQVS